MATVTDPRRRMVRRQIAGRGIADCRVLAVMEKIPRFIGVIHRPETERQSHSAEVELPGQFDAYVWFDRTTAATPLPTVQRPGVPEIYTFGL